MALVHKNGRLAHAVRNSKGKISGGFSELSFYVFAGPLVCD
jgi:hypothetical protein